MHATVHLLRAARVPARLLHLALLAVLIGAGLTLTSPAAPAAATTPYTVASRVSGNGTSATPYVHNITITDCTQFPTPVAGQWEPQPPSNDWNRLVTVDDSSPVDSWHTINLTIAKAAPFLDGTTAGVGCGVSFLAINLDSVNNQNYAHNAIASDGTVLTQTFQLKFADPTQPFGNARFQVIWDNYSGSPVTREFLGAFFVVSPAQVMSPPPQMFVPAGSASADPVSETVALAVEQATAAGVEGTSTAVLVRGGQVVPMTSRLTSAAGPRGGVVIEAEDLKVTLASSVGARADSGVVVPQSGTVECTLCAALVPGSVVEVWVNSDPRLTAAVAVPADAEPGDCVGLTIPVGAPLDGDGPIEAGAHTLQLRMYTDEGLEVVSTGLTVGGVSPSGIPAGEGPGSAPTWLLLGAALAAGAVITRRMVVAD